MRCLALADRLRMQEMDCVFLCRDGLGRLAGLIEAPGHELRIIGPMVEGHNHEQVWPSEESDEDANLTLGLCGDGDSLLVVDHYSVGDRWLKAVEAKFKEVLVIDDLANRYLTCDFLLNQTLGCSPVEYDGFVNPATSLLLGSKYALLRSEFESLREKALNERYTRSGVKNILLALGGADPENNIAQIIHGMADYLRLRSVKATVVLGHEAPHTKAIQDLAGQKGLCIDLLENVGNMGELMLKADLAIGAGGSSSWERACMGLPTILVCLAENQKLLCSRLEANGAACMGWDVRFEQSPGKSFHEALERYTENEEYRRLAIENCFDITDGIGATRVADQLLTNMKG